MNDHMGFWIFTGAIFGAATMAIGYGISLDRSLWIHDKALIEVAIEAGTMLALIAAGIVGFRTYQVGLSASLSTRFKDAAELLDGGNAQARAGVTLMAQLAAEKPEVYGMAAVKALLAAATRAEAANLELISRDTKGRLRINMPASSPKTTSEGGDALFAATRLYSTLIPQAHDIRGETHRDLMPIGPIYLGGHHFHSTPMKRLLIQSSAFGRCSFNEFDFTETEMHVTFGGHVIFRHCQLAGLEIDATDKLGNPIEPNSLYCPTFQDCEGVDSAVMNGLPLQVFIDFRANRRSAKGGVVKQRSHSAATNSAGSTLPDASK